MLSGVHEFYARYQLAIIDSDLPEFPCDFSALPDLNQALWTFLYGMFMNGAFDDMRSKTRATKQWKGKK